LNLGGIPTLSASIHYRRLIYTAEALILFYFLFKYPLATILAMAFSAGNQTGVKAHMAYSLVYEKHVL